MAEKTLGFITCPGGTFPILGSSSAVWTLREGPQPVIETIELRPEHAKALVARAAGGRVQITFEVNDAKVDVKNVYCVHVAASDNPFLGRATVADRRWFWRYKHIKRDYNIRRRVGYKRPVKPDAPAVTIDITDRVWYAPYSLRDAERGAAGKWTADQILLDILKEACSLEGIEDFDVDPNLGAKIRSIPIEDLSIDESADNAISHVLTYMPEAAVAVDLEGHVRIYSKASGREVDERQNLGPEIVGRGHTEFVNYDFLRPKEVHVLFTRECEVRFDFKEIANNKGTRGSAPENDRREATNVLPVPDFEIELADGRKVPQGAWITFDEAFTAKNWQNVPGVGVLDHPIVQQALMPNIDLWAQVMRIGTTVPDQDWAARIAAINRHYRKTYKLPRRWMDKIASLRPYRVAILDPATGARAPAPVYTDFAYVNSQRSIIKDAIGNEQDLAYYVNVSGYRDFIGVGTFSAPVVLQILDADQGIIHIDHVVDENRIFEMMLPSQVDETYFPSGNIRQVKADHRAIGFNAVKEGKTVGRLKANHRLSFIVTCVAGSGMALHKIVVKPKDVESLLPSNPNLGLDNARGPVMEVRVGAGLETARVMWSDDKRADIEACFGLPNRNAVPNLTGLVVNEGDISDPKNGAALHAIAKAVAARVYAGYINRFEGSATGHLNNGVRLDGWMSEVQHQITSAGEGTTQITLPDRIAKFDLLAFLDDGTRAIILRQAQG